jgi:hypothetical protein
VIGKKGEEGTNRFDLANMIFRTMNQMRAAPTREEATTMRMRAVFESPPWFESFAAETAEAVADAYIREGKGRQVSSRVSSRGYEIRRQVIVPW